MLYDGKDCAAEGPSRGCLLEKTYVSHLGDWAAFALLLWVALLRKRFDGAKLLIILSDGSDWIRSRAAWLPIQTFLILYLYHVEHRIFEVAHAVFGEHTRMKYHEYRARGLRVSSAAVESANFHVSGTRLKLQGRRWSAEGAAQMAVLRTDLFNGQWEERTRRLLAG